MTTFWEKGGIVFKGGHYIREDINQGNTVGVKLVMKLKLGHS